MKWMKFVLLTAVLLVSSVSWAVECPEAQAMKWSDLSGIEVQEISDQGVFSKQKKKLSELNLSEGPVVFRVYAS